jgi:hypothetical protein
LIYAEQVKLNLAMEIQMSGKQTQVPPQCRTVDVVTAGRDWFGLGRSASYAAAARGELPVIRIGKRLVAPIAALDRMLEQVSVKKSAA